MGLNKIIKLGSVKKNVELKKHTTIKVGGRAKYFVVPANEQEFLDLLFYLNNKNLKYFILGNGSNVIGHDHGFNGVVICTKNINKIRLIEPSVVRAFMGASLNSVINFCANNNLSGMENGFGIPASVGGAVKMNAGAYGFEIKNCVKGVMSVCGGKLKYFSNAECKFDYRKSCFNKNNIVLFADFELDKVDDNKSIFETMKQIQQKRKLSQPLELPSAGSVFKRHDGVIVSKLIDELGLKGTRVGDMEVSTKHAGFIVNTGAGSCKDFFDLVDKIKKQVEISDGISLKTEVELIE